MDKNENLIDVFHELKNPLATIKINLELLREYQNKRQRKNFDVIENEVNKIENIVHKYITFTKEKHLEKKHVHIYTVIHNIIDENKLSYPDVKFELTDKNNCFIIGYEYHMYMIFSNITKNAIEAINGIGNISIEIFKDEKLVSIHIKDDGLGIKENEFKKIQNEFYTSKINGSGIGTTIITNIINKYNGNFYLTNNEDQGATAIIELPTSKT